MSQRQAANAGARCPAETTIATLARPTGTNPIRCAIATLRMGQRRFAWAARRRISATAMRSYASYSRRTTRRPAFWLRVVPRKTTSAPAAGSRTARTRRSSTIGARTMRNIV
jgi:hypothetical protein